MPHRPSGLSRRPSARPALRAAALAARLAVVALLAACASRPGALDLPALRYDGFDACARNVTTVTPEAQAWFDQGLTLLYGFNHTEAMRSFHAATQADPLCSMAWWGLAVAAGPDINNQQMSPEEQRLAYEAAQEALRTSRYASPVEAALARAIATRYAWPAPEDREALDEAYADAMASVYEQHPDDPDVATCYADALMNLSPWDYWTPEGEAKGRIDDAIEALEHARRLAPGHAGANHFLVHALEAGHPERAEAAADDLALAVPGSGHLLHMPSHIYVHLGRYADAYDCNARAVAADQAYFERTPDPDFYFFYHAHNVHMLAYAAVMEGREHAAMYAARQLERAVPDAFVRENAGFVDGLMGTPLHVMVRFGRWEEILVEPAPPEYRLLSVAQWHYARGVALAALGRTDEARREQAAFEAQSAIVPVEWKMGSNEWKDFAAVASEMLAGEILWREGRREEAFAALREGVAAEDAMVYDEPPGWMQPVRHTLGALLMADARAAEAEEVYRADLERHPGNGWSVLGLEQALRAQEKTAEAEEAAATLAVVWARADVQATSSCFCEPRARGPTVDG